MYAKPLRKVEYAQYKAVWVDGGVFVSLILAKVELSAGFVDHWVSVLQQFGKRTLVVVVFGANNMKPRTGLVER